MLSDSTGIGVFQYQDAACEGPSTSLGLYPLAECAIQFQQFYYYVDSNVDLNPKVTTQCVGKAPPGPPRPPGPPGPPAPPNTVPKNPPSKTGSKNPPSKSAPKSFRAA